MAIGVIIGSPQNLGTLAVRPAGRVLLQPAIMELQDVGVVELIPVLALCLSDKLTHCAASV